MIYAVVSHPSDSHDPIPAKVYKSFERALRDIAEESGRKVFKYTEDGKVDDDALYRRREDDLILVEDSDGVALYTISELPGFEDEEP